MLKHKNLLTLVVILLLSQLSAGCMRVIKYNPNADLIRESVRQAIAGSKLPGIVKGQKVTIVNMERLKSEEFLPDSIIHDELVRAVTLKGATVVQKDDEVLVNLVHEASGDTLKYAVTTRHGGVDNPFPYDARVESRTEATEGNKLVPTLPTHALDCERKLAELYEKKTHEKVKEETTINQTLKETKVLTSKNTVQYLKKEEPRVFSKLKTASKVLSYRTVECGLDYASTLKTVYPWYFLWNEPVKKVDRKNIRRQAKTILDLQIANAKTGLVYYADTVKAVYEDVIPKKVVPHAELSHHMYYPYNMPNISDLEKGRIVTGRLDSNLAYKDTVDELDEWVNDYLPWFIGWPLLLAEKIVFEPVDLIRWFKKADCNDPYLEAPPDQFELSVDGPINDLE